jgi:hypothetical protein
VRVDAAKAANYHDLPKPEWRNWYTRQTQNLARFNSHVGASPPSLAHKTSTLPRQVRNQMDSVYEAHQAGGSHLLKASEKPRALDHYRRSFMLIFEELGSLVEKRWRDVNYRESLFPETAACVLAEANLIERIDPWQIIRWVQGTSNLPPQQDIDAKFGNPPITLYVAPRFYIDVYYWLDGTTDIHQHSFSGAFQVFLGSSIHSHYRFENSQAINEHFLIGNLKLENVTLLKRGDIQPIFPGASFVHSLFHLDRPSATITIRTNHTPTAAPQYSYRRPCIGEDPFFKEPSITRKVQTLSLLFGMNHPETDVFAEELLHNSDLQTSFAVLEAAYRHLTSNSLQRVFDPSASHERFQHLIQIARGKHGELVEIFPAVFEERERQSEIVRRRQFITREEHRFLLALLLNVPERRMLLELVGARFSEGDPVETVINWLEELSLTRVFGSTEANVLGIGGFDDDTLFVLECLFRGQSVEQMKSTLKNEYPAKATDECEAKLSGLARDLSASMLFKALFAGSLGQLPT